MLRFTIFAAALVAQAHPARADGLLFDPGADDPKIARPRAHEAASRAHPAPVIKFAYRHLTVDDFDHTNLTFHAVELDMYPLSQRWVRLGVELEVGFGSGNYSPYYALAGLTAGLQYPWRVTPFVELRSAGGVIGADVLKQTAVSYAFVVGLDAGVELYVVDRLYVSAAIGWTRFGYRGVDVKYEMDHPTEDRKYQDVRSDAFTFKLGFGL